MPTVMEAEGWGLAAARASRRISMKVLAGASLLPRGGEGSRNCESGCRRTSISFKCASNLA